MFWLVFWILVCVAILAYGIRRMANHDYRFGSGLLKIILTKRTSLSIRIIMTKRIFLNNIKQNLRLLSCSKSLLLCKNAPALYGSISYFIAFINL